MRTRAKYSKTSRDSATYVPTQMIARTADILRILFEGARDIDSICQKLNLSKPTTYRLMRSLERTGFVLRDPLSKRFQLGPFITKIASNHPNTHESLITCAQQELLRLQTLSGETVCLLVQSGTYGQYVDEYVSTEALKFSAGKGSITPLYAGAGGKVILAELPRAKLKIVLDNSNLVSVGPRTIVDRKILLKELEKIKKEGYAISFEEKLTGCAGIAVPVRNYVAPVALDILGPSIRLQPKMNSLIKEIVESAERISMKLLKLR